MGSELFYFPAIPPIFDLNETVQVANTFGHPLHIMEFFAIRSSFSKKRRYVL